MDHNTHNYYVNYKHPFVTLHICTEEYLEIFYFDCAEGNKISVSHMLVYTYTYEGNEICYA